ncbi:MAG TPA: SAM-dependent chlorinase/fluorinase [Candidatus Methanoperedenaceae archaeon]|nr:SAM-dependent chlorinase/fluorinase [Candidatus Methanoperedenaceae archaeon]
MPPITLLSDFGQFYPSIMKGVILNINHHAAIVDITHSVQPQNIREGAFLLMCAAPYFPSGTVHIAVVDPGVGTSRRAIAVEARGHDRARGYGLINQYFVGPDNGILIPAARRTGEITVYAIDESDFPDASRTFHGRDIFAPVGALLSKGHAINELGTPVDDYKIIDFEMSLEEKRIRGEVIYIDSFGNIITSIPGSIVAERARFGSDLRVNGRTMRFLQTYGLAAGGEPLATIGSHQCLEIAMNRRSAAMFMRLSVGDRVEVVF